MVLVLTTLLTVVIATGIFAAAAYLGIELNVVVQGKRGHRPQATLLIIGASALFGACLALRHLSWQDLAMAAIVCISLAACSHGAIEAGKISDYFLLVPLSAILISDIAQQNWWLLLSPTIPFVPFAVAAYVSKGKGMGWDDAKLAALGGAILGSWFALLAIAAACVIASIIAWAGKKTRDPVLLAPYMAASIMLCLLITIS
jgi:hypothetical protein